MALDECPTELGGIPIHYDGHQLVHTFRQSTLNDLDLCPERGRRVLTATMPRQETDATAVGTAVHAGIEYALEHKRDSALPPMGECTSVAVNEWAELEHEHDIEYVKYKSDGAPETFIRNAMECWYTQAQPQIEPLLLEHTFSEVVLYSDERRRIELTGTIDLLCQDTGLGDHKTTTREGAYLKGWGGDAWEKERWAIQPTVYTYAAVNDRRWPGSKPLASGPKGYPFTYWALVRQPYNEVELQVLTVWRHTGDWQWLAQKALGVARLVEAELDVWPKNDGHALCSPTWCPAWGECKGAHYEDGWPKPSLPLEVG